MAELEGVKMTCRCEVCKHFFRCEATDGPRHVFRTQGGRLLVLCDCCITAARFEKHAREVLLEGGRGVPETEWINRWGYE